MKILIYDVHASESGALAILNDLYRQIRSYPDKSIKWVFVVSTPVYEDAENITILRFPWVKKSWGHRLYFDNVITRQILPKYQPEKIFSLQNKGISFCDLPQLVYLHLPFVLCDHKFDIKRDGKTLWLYQNVLSKSIFKSLRKVNKTIVQTQWMKEALIKKAGVKRDKIELLAPDVSTNSIGNYIDTPENRKRFFYPATAFTYKNHKVILEAFNTLQNNGFNDYEIIFTIRPDENEYTKMLSSYVRQHSLNVKFIGSISREEVFEMYTKCVLLFPSFVESFGLPLLEARLSGAFVIANKSPFSEEILKDYNNAMFFEAKGAKELVTCVMKLDAMLYASNERTKSMQAPSKSLVELCVSL